MSTTTTTPVRRTVSFAKLDDIMPDVDRLLEGHITVGNWSLGQICNHLSRTMTYSVEGFPSMAPWLLRKTIAPVFFRRMMKTGTMPSGAKGPDYIMPKPGLDARAEAEALRAAVRMYLAHTGPMPDHPFFDKLSRDQWDRLHCMHCALHLSFAQPTAPKG